MNRQLAIAVLIALAGTAALADSLRSDKHLIRIDARNREYSVQVFDAESRTAVAQLKVVTAGNTPAVAETIANGTRYDVRIEPHGAAYLIAFTAHAGTELIDTMRGGFTERSALSDAIPQSPQRAGRDVDEPAVLRRVEPVFTEDAKAAGAAGTVVLEVHIDKSGFVQNVQVLKPMGYGLSESAIEAVRQWQFAPSMQGRVPVEVVQEVTLTFKP